MVTKRSLALVALALALAAGPVGAGAHPEDHPGDGDGGASWVRYPVQDPPKGTRWRVAPRSRTIRVYFVGMVPMFVISAARPVEA